jgi:phenylalanyl-tRNA synthetase beta chain
MIVKFCGGEVSKAKVAGKEPIETRVIPFDFVRIEKLSGVKLPDAEIATILTDLGFKIEGKPQAAKVTVPTWRPDVHGPADLVEEVVRIAGLDLIPATPLPRLDGVARPVLTEKQKRARRARRLLASRGFIEAVTWSFIPKDQATHFGGGNEALDLANPISTELSSMRPGLLPGLLTAVTRNRNRGSADVALFEIGQAYRGEKPDDQYLAAAGVRAGTARFNGAGRHWDGSAEAVDVFDVKADVIAALAALGIDAGKAQITRDCPPWYHPGRSGTLRLGPKNVLAYFGEVHPATLKALDVEAPVAAFEIFIDALPPEKKKSRAKPALAASDLLPVKRDLAFIVSKDVAAGDVMKAASTADKALIRAINVFDVFEGGNLATEGKKSIAIEVTLQPVTETLTDQAIDTIIKKIIADVKKATGGELRS